MALFEINGANRLQSVRLLETVLFTNLVPGTALAVSKAVPVPDWAETAQFCLNITTLTGTSPLVDFTLSGTYNLDTTFSWLLGDWDGITQLTGTGPYVVLIDIGPSVLADDTGSATANSRYGVASTLPPWIVYKYTLDATTNDEDYAFDIRCKFGRR